MNLLRRFFVAVCVLCVGCAGVNRNGTDVTESMPGWINGPSSIPGYYVGVGSDDSVERGYHEKVKVAKLRAKRALAASVAVEVTSMLTDSTVVEGEGEAEIISSERTLLIREEVNRMIKNVHVKDVWKDPQTKTVWVRVVMSEVQLISGLTPRNQPQLESSEHTVAGEVSTTQAGVQRSSKENHREVKEAVGQAQVSMASRTQEEARNLAVTRATQDAIENVAGTRLKAKTVMIGDRDPVEFLKSETYGSCIHRTILDEKILNSENPEDAKYYVRLRATVALDKSSEDPSFQIKVQMNRRTYELGDRMKISVTPTKDCYVHIFNILPDGRVLALFPNQVHPDNFVKANRELQFPSVEDAARGISARASIQGDATHVTERMMVVATRNVLELEDDFAESFVGNEEAPTQIETVLYRKMFKIPASQKVTEEVVYQIHRRP